MNSIFFILFLFLSLPYTYAQDMLAPKISSIDTLPREIQALIAWYCFDDILPKSDSKVWNQVETKNYVVSHQKVINQEYSDLNIIFKKQKKEVSYQKFFLRITVLLLMKLLYGLNHMNLLKNN